MKHIFTLTILFIAGLCAAQVGEVDIQLPEPTLIYRAGPPTIGEPVTKNTDPLYLTIEDVQDVVCKDNEPLRALVRLWYVQALHTGRNEAQAIEIALDKLGKLLVEKLENK